MTHVPLCLFQKNGVAVQTKSKEERASYTHSYAHSINLAIGNTMKVCPVLKGAINNNYELTKLVKMFLMLNSTSFKWKITLVAAMKMASLLIDLKTPP